jgi:hypothetical protein
VGDDDRYPVSPGTVLSSGTPTVQERATSPPPGPQGHAAGTRSRPGDAVKPALAPGITSAPAAAPAPGAPAQPSWSRILATTTKLWVSRRARSFGSEREGGPGPGNRRSFRWHPGRPGQVGARRRPAAVLVLALAVIAAAALGFAELSRTPPPAGRAPSAGSALARSAVRAGTPGPPSPAAAAQAQAAAWIVSQVSSGAIIACDPAMCAALQAQRASVGRLLPMPPGSDNPLGASVVVTASPMSRRLADEYAPAMIASFGSGRTRVDVRATEPGGAAAYESALRADLAARRSAGAQLLRNWRIRFTRAEAAQLRAGEVDSRLLATLAALSSQYPIRVTAFGDASPGVPVLYREVTVTSGGSGDGTAELTAALALVNAQDPPFQPAHAAIIHPAAGRAALIIEFPEPSPLGLLTAVLAADQQPAAARTRPTADAVGARKTLID